ncbi:DEKNAAC105170 [Brettanomyces naardenensis]|uniref:DEKNAAC105170 n=1 Tax=Brettanomyces naardenensis TaxID=13370 RepID=A0A448YSR0_BRENA|nr:DEKNAAC105170 [Brettanomyces naardenensis]
MLSREARKEARKRGSARRTVELDDIVLEPPPIETERIVDDEIHQPVGRGRPKRGANSVSISASAGKVSSKKVSTEILSSSSRESSDNEGSTPARYKLRGDDFDVVIVGEKKAETVDEVKPKRGRPRKVTPKKVTPKTTPKKVIPKATPKTINPKATPRKTNPTATADNTPKRGRPKKAAQRATPRASSKTTPNITPKKAQKAIAKTTSSGRKRKVDIDVRESPVKKRKAPSSRRINDEVEDQKSSKDVEPAERIGSPEEPGSPPSASPPSASPPSASPSPSFDGTSAFNKSRGRISKSYTKKVDARTFKSHKRGRRKENSRVVQIKYRRMPANKTKLITVDVIGQILSDCFSKKSLGKLSSKFQEEGVDQKKFAKFLANYRSFINDYFDSLIDLQLSNNLILYDLSAVNREKNQCRLKIFDTREELNENNIKMTSIRQNYLQLRKRYDEKLKVYNKLLELQRLQRKEQGNGEDVGESTIGSSSQALGSSTQSLMATVKYGLANLKKVSTPGYGLVDKLKAVNEQMEEIISRQI